MDGIATWELGGWDRKMETDWVGSRHGNGVNGIVAWKRDEWDRDREMYGM